ncbi:MAG: Ig-like domain-containing protein [Akkermansiaceae bacterium]|nr:Ig-like domain-containing protein [Armatimonadota bacterium]
MKRRHFLQGCAGVALTPLATAYAQAPNPADPLAVPPGYIETHRLRIVNRVNGAISVSTDGGKNWQLIGRVLVPATTVVQGYIAAEYADPGTVAAIAVHGHRIRVSASDASLHAPLILSLDPREYAGKAPNTGYGGHRPGSAGIFTNIGAGTSLFRELAPHVGNPVLREDSGTGKVTPLSNRFSPNGAGEIILIPVWVPADALTQVVFPNKKGGFVKATFASGATRELMQVVKTVQGVGRFDGTAYTGVGRLNTAHTGVITVCTAPVDGALPEGEGKERRGGFQISPAWHNARCEEAGAPMVMTVGASAVPRRKDSEGTAPLFRDAVSLGNQTTAEVSIVDVAIDGGNWEPMPTIIGLRLDAFTGPGLTKVWRERGSKRTAEQGVTAFRLRLDTPTSARSEGSTRSAVVSYIADRRRAAKRGELSLVSGIITIESNAANNRAVAWARLIVEGNAKGFTNAAPFTFSWDTRTVPDGEYLVETETLDSGGVVVATAQRRVFVGNDRT